MSDQAMRYYERELAYIRKALGEFADEHPEQAAQLQLGRSSVEDPNISRMIDGMALLTAKTEQRLDQQFPDLVQDLFTLLYPGMLEPTASYFPLRLAPLAEQMKEPQTLRAGALLSANTPDGENCHFTTVADLKVYPYLLCDVSAQAAPFTTLAPKSLHGAQAVIQLRLDCADPQANFSQLELGDLEFYVDGFEGNAEPLIDLLLEQTCCISVSDLAGEQHRELALEQLVNRATQTDFQWLSTHANQFSGFDLLRDYFSYPDKSAYFVLQGFAAAAAHFESAHLVLNIYLKTLPAEFLRLFNDQVFSLYTVPAINRFTQLAEPLQYDASALSMPVIADAENSSAEVLRVDAVYEIDAYGQQRLSPLYKQRYAEGERRRRWQCRQLWDNTGVRRVELSVGVTEQELSRESITLALDLTCSNGRAPCTIATGSEVQNLSNTDLPGELSVAQVPTGPVYPDLQDELYWRLIALLNTNFSVLQQAEDPAGQLRDMLALCHQGREAAQVGAIVALSFKPTVGSVQVDGQPIFSSGSEVELTLDRRTLKVSASVFAQVINVFLQQFCSYDRFVQLRVRHFGDDNYRREFKAVQGSQLCL